MKVFKSKQGIMNLADTNNVLLMFDKVNDEGIGISWFVDDIEHTGNELPKEYFHHNIRNYVFDTSYYRRCNRTLYNLAVFRLYHPQSNKKEKFVHLYNPIGVHSPVTGQYYYDLTVGQGQPMIKGYL